MERTEIIKFINTKVYAGRVKDKNLLLSSSFEAEHSRRYLTGFLIMEMLLLLLPIIMRLMQKSLS